MSLITCEIYGRGAREYGDYRFIVELNLPAVPNKGDLVVANQKKYVVDRRDFMGDYTTVHVNCTELDTSGLL